MQSTTRQASVVHGWLWVWLLLGWRLGWRMRCNPSLPSWCKAGRSPQKWERDCREPGMPGQELHPALPCLSRILGLCRAWSESPVMREQQQESTWNENLNLGIMIHLLGSCKFFFYLISLLLFKRLLWWEAERSEQSGKHLACPRVCRNILFWYNRYQGRSQFLQYNKYLRTASPRKCV